MLIPFGVLSAAGAEVAGDYELISTEILTSSQSSITFSSLGDYSATYKHLQLRATVANVGINTNATGLFIRINGDTGTNYTRHSLEGNGTSVASSASIDTTNVVIQNMVPRTIDTSRFGATVIDFLDTYSATKNKTIRALHGALASTETVIGLSSGVFRNTASMTSISLTSNEDFAAGSRFSLYGIKG